jgi:hypothetical protein
MAMHLTIVVSSDGRVIAATKHHQGAQSSGMRPAHDNHILHRIELPPHLEAARLEVVVGQLEIGSDGHPKFKRAP